MSGPSIPGAAAFPLPPPLASMPIVDLRTGIATPLFQRVLTAYFTALQGTGGVVDFVNDPVPSYPSTTQEALDLIDQLRCEVTQLRQDNASLAEQVDRLLRAPPPLPNGYVDSIVFDSGARILVGVGAPGAVVMGSPPDIYLNKSAGAGTTLYVKESGANTTGGWVGK